MKWYRAISRSSNFSKVSKIWPSATHSTQKTNCTKSMTSIFKTNRNWCLSKWKNNKGEWRRKIMCPLGKLRCVVSHKDYKSRMTMTRLNCWGLRLSQSSSIKTQKSCEEILWNWIDPNTQINSKSKSSPPHNPMEWMQTKAKFWHRRSSRLLRLLTKIPMEQWTRNPETWVTTMRENLVNLCLKGACNCQVRLKSRARRMKIMMHRSKSMTSSCSMRMKIIFSITTWEQM